MPRAPKEAAYQIRTEFHAPLEFVFRWCTDFTPKDAQYEADSYQRRILRRSKRFVVFEDLEDSEEGWIWARHVVRLEPPNRWHSDSTGNHRTIRLDYRLSRLPGGRTRLVLTAHRRPAGIGGKNPSRSQRERTVGRSWKSLGKSLERDIRKRRERRT